MGWGFRPEGMMWGLGFGESAELEYQVLPTGSSEARTHPPAPQTLGRGEVRWERTARERRDQRSCRRRSPSLGLTPTLVSHHVQAMGPVGERSKGHRPKTLLPHAFRPSPGLQGFCLSSEDESGVMQSWCSGVGGAKP